MIFFNRLIVNKICNVYKRCFSQTIFALSSGQGKCGVAVIRVSGPDAESALTNLTGLRTLEPRKAVLRSIKHPQTKEVLDKGLILWFPAPNSFTGEDCCEFHVHGGPAVVNAVLNALSILPDTQPAEPGEFTRRAFYNGKLDLTKVEGLADLLQAETEVQRKQAFLQSQGALSKLYFKWRDLLIKSLAHISAYIDFEATETIDSDTIDNVVKDIRKLSRELEDHLNDGRKGELLRQGVKTVILGEPNVGKSSLLNLLCQRPAAIVTPIEGTTRDVLEVTLNINGYPLVLADTAGIRNRTNDVIEEEGIKRAIACYDNADLVLLVVNAATCVDWMLSNSSKSILPYLKHYTKLLSLNNLIDDENLLRKKCIVILNKTDLVKSSLELQNENAVCLSCTTTDGVDVLIEKISTKLKELCGEPTKEHPSMTQARHKLHISHCLLNIQTFLEESERGRDTLFMAENLRRASYHLGQLVGATSTEQLLDVIFKDFCIGK